MEQLYFLLGKAKDLAQEIFAESQNEITSDLSNAASRQLRRKHQAAKKIIDWCNEEPDLKPAEGKPAQLRSQIEKQKQINANALSTYGSDRAGLVERLKGDIPKSATPWESVIRHLGAKHLGRSRLRSPRRPSPAPLSRYALIHSLQSGRMANTKQMPSTSDT